MNKTKALGSMFALVVALLAWISPAGAGEIHDAAKAGDVEKINALLKGNPDLVNAKGYHGLTPLHYAAVEGHKTAVELLLANKADVNVKAEWEYGGSTPLALAAFYDRAEIVELLLKHKAEPDPKDKEGWTPLSWAEDHDYKASARILRQYGAAVDAPPAVRQWSLSNSGVAAPEIVVCRNDEAWSRAWGRVSKAVPTHLQTNQLGVVIFIGQRPTGGYRVNLTSTGIVAGSYVVAYKEETPHGFVTQAITTPCVFALFPHTDLSIKVAKEDAAESGGMNGSVGAKEPVQDEVESLKSKIKSLQEENVGRVAQINDLKGKNDQLVEELRRATDTIKELTEKLRRVEGVVGKPGIHPNSQP